MSKILKYLPELEGDEQVEVARLVNEMSDTQAEHFARIYRSRRKDPVYVLILSAVGFVGVAGLQRLYGEEIGLGLVYLLTAGLCVVGTIHDVIKYEDIAYRYNREIALNAAETVHTVYENGTSDVE